MDRSKRQFIHLQQLYIYIQYYYLNIQQYKAVITYISFSQASHDTIASQQKFLTCSCNFTAGTMRWRCHVFTSRRRMGFRFKLLLQVSCILNPLGRNFLILSVPLENICSSESSKSFIRHKKKIRKRRKFLLLQISETRIKVAKFGFT